MRFILYIIIFIISFGGIAQQTKEVDFLTGNVTVFLDATFKKIEGKVIYTFKILKPTSSITIDAQKMQIMGVTLDGLETDVAYDNEKIKVTSDF